MDSIRFGTSGWRGIIAQDFTFANVTLVAQAIATYLKRELKRKKSPIYGRQPKIILGHDTRFMGPEFTRTVAEVLAENGLQPLMCQRDAPTPVIAHAIRQKRAMAGINMTASHNPAAYQGLKLSMHNGAGASQKVTQAIEREIVKLQRKEWLRKTRMESGWQCRTFDPKEAYIKLIRSLIDFKKIKRAKMKVAVECMYGTEAIWMHSWKKQAPQSPFFMIRSIPVLEGTIPSPMPKAWPRRVRVFSEEKLSWVWGWMGMPIVLALSTRMGPGSLPIKSWPSHCIISARIVVSRVLSSGRYRQAIRLTPLRKCLASRFTRRRLASSTLAR